MSNWSGKALYSDNPAVLRIIYGTTCIYNNARSLGFFGVADTCFVRVRGEECFEVPLDTVPYELDKWLERRLVLLPCF